MYIIKFYQFARYCYRCVQPIVFQGSDFLLYTLLDNYVVRQGATMLTKSVIQSYRGAICEENVCLQDFELGRGGFQ